MKKMKKLFAILMTMAMVMGLGITGFAAPADVQNPPESSITVTGLSAGVDTDINGYKFATLQYDSETNEYSWKIAGWAEDYVTLNAEGTAFEIAKEDEDDLKNAILTGRVTPDSSVTKQDIKETSYTFTEVEIGGYILIPMDENADYNPLFAVNTYDRADSPDENGKPVAEDITVVAKSEGHTIVKEQTDDFAQIGSSVNYTIKATFPAYTNSDGETLESFVITDTPTGLDIDETTVKVMLGTEELTEQSGKITIVKADNGVLTVTFNKSVLLEANEGKDIVITYTATVTDTSYNNSVSATSDTTDYTPGSVDGSNGAIEITKVDAESKATLFGAEFEVYDLGNGTWDEENKGTPMSFVYDSEKGKYRPALPTEQGNAIVKTNENGSEEEDGILTIVGLDEGNYHFVEKKAPDGYSINKGGLTVTVTDGVVKTVTAEFEDTKMAELPETGGMGTTLFTIAGCVIMISAAGLFFATRKKAN